ncbi:MAG: hypothetical protein QOE55_5536, partial [Acidobacteriaceae bacterium]|nr:hypothetical protein [Acidobacteriaceae bacterium]
MRPNVTEDISKPFSGSRGILSNFDKLWSERERSRMPGLGLNTVRIGHGLRVVTLENELLRVQILPEAGAKIWQITYLPLD